MGVFSKALLLWLVTDVLLGPIPSRGHAQREMLKENSEGGGVTLGQTQTFCIVGVWFLLPSPGWGIPNFGSGAGQSQSEF